MAINNGLGDKLWISFVKIWLGIRVELKLGLGLRYDMIVK